MSRIMPAHSAAYPGLQARLWVAQPLSLLQEQELGTYARGDQSDLVAELEAACLRGRGGAGFPAHIKWRAVAQAEGNKVVLANGEEGEPASFKDRWLLTHRPHLVIDGLLLAAQTTGATRAIIYLSHPETVVAVRAALAEAEAAGIDVAQLEVFEVEGTYVAGEETAACRAINGGPALPTSRPPRPFEQGVDGVPTLVSNVETLAHAAWIHQHGAEAYRSCGTADSPGTTLITLGGNCRQAGIFEIPFGLSLQQVIDQLGGGTPNPVTGLVIGGWFGGLLPADRTDLLCDFGACREAGTGWGCGAITVLDEAMDPVRFAADVGRWYQAESAQQCGVCIKGTAAIASTLTKLEDGQAQQADVDNLLRWGKTFPGRGACAFLDGAAALSRSLVVHFPQALQERLSEEVKE